MFKKTMIAAALAVASSAVLAAPTFQEADVNGDGKVSMEEASTVEGLDFKTADANGDGGLDADEYKAATGG
ncbi:MAG: hypothetical protein H6983_03645 [Ectothiorhodospiraceae bacterium]|nr:hypothetical protein [Ectothiorhodospiraceae bacterium]